MKAGGKVWLLVLMVVLFSCNSEIEEFSETESLPDIFPDYTGIKIPPNIAPLNFKINEEGTDFEAHFYVDKKNPVVVRNDSPEIQINISKWHKLLEEGKGSNLYNPSGQQV